MIAIKRTYEPKARADGQRLLVERLWPRGLTKEALAADGWLKEVAPTGELRKWFDHRVERWDEFQRRYRAELDENPSGWQPILDAAARGPVTLLYSAHDTLHNGALVLRDYLAERSGGARRAPKRAPGAATRPAARKKPAASAAAPKRAAKPRAR
ncbi:MAG: DUF488 family protein [Sorangiineae bacterium]|nr:DUF488 family protein [Polyangiaceae bacterium]MEB2324337.1 DUF488 family protein [Sorangiineae bacterium]